MKLPLCWAFTNYLTLRNFRKLTGMCHEETCLCLMVKTNQPAHLGLGVIKGTLEDSVDPDQVQQNVVFDQSVLFALHTGISIIIMINNNKKTKKSTLK